MSVRYDLVKIMENITQIWRSLALCSTWREQRSQAATRLGYIGMQHPVSQRGLWSG